MWVACLHVAPCSSTTVSFTGTQDRWRPSLLPPALPTMNFVFASALLTPRSHRGHVEGPRCHLCVVGVHHSPGAPNLGTPLSVMSANLPEPCPREGDITSIPLGRNEICPVLWKETLSNFRGWSLCKHPSSATRAQCLRLEAPRKRTEHGESLPKCPHRKQLTSPEYVVSHCDLLETNRQASFY